MLIPFDDMIELMLVPSDQGDQGDPEIDQPSIDAKSGGSSKGDDRHPCMMPSVVEMNLKMGRCLFLTGHLFRACQ